MSLARFIVSDRRFRCFVVLVVFSSVFLFLFSSPSLFKYLSEALFIVYIPLLFISLSLSSPIFHFSLLSSSSFKLSLSDLSHSLMLRRKRKERVRGKKRNEKTHKSSIIRLSIYSIRLLFLPLSSSSVSRVERRM